jgi:hypothetical protein
MARQDQAHRLSHANARHESKVGFPVSVDATNSAIMERFFLNKVQHRSAALQAQLRP